MAFQQKDQEEKNPKQVNALRFWQGEIVFRILMKMHRCWSPSSVTKWTGYTPETFLGADDKFHYLRNAKLETVFESQTARGKERRPAVVVKRSQSNFWFLKKQIFFFFFFKKDSSNHVSRTKSRELQYFWTDVPVFHSLVYAF